MMMVMVIVMVIGGKDGGLPPKRRQSAETEPAIDWQQHGCTIESRDSGHKPPEPP